MRPAAALSNICFQRTDAGQCFKAAEASASARSRSLANMCMSKLAGSPRTTLDDPASGKNTGSYSPSINNENEIVGSVASAQHPLCHRHNDDVRAFPRDDLKRTCVAIEEAQTAFNIFGRFSR
jgi:hypothetical protein